MRLDPSLLNKSVEENLEPKLYFFERELLRGSRAELRDWVVKKSPCLSYSLTNRYRPRLEACRAAGVDAKRVLSYATNSDEIFCKHTGIDPEDLTAIRESRRSLTTSRPRASCPARRAALVASALSRRAPYCSLRRRLSPVNIGDRSLQVGRGACCRCRGGALGLPPAFARANGLTLVDLSRPSPRRTTEDLVDGAALTIDYARVGDGRRRRLQRVRPARPRLQASRRASGRRRCRAAPHIRARCTSRESRRYGVLSPALGAAEPATGRWSMPPEPRPPGTTVQNAQFRVMGTTMTSAAAPQWTPSPAPAQPSTMEPGMCGGVYLTKYAKNAESARSLPRKKTSESSAQASPKSSQPSKEADVPDGAAVTSDGVSVSAASASTPCVNRAYSASASCFPSAKLQPDATANRYMAKAMVVLPKQVQPAWSATHHDSSGAL